MSYYTSHRRRIELLEKIGGRAEGDIFRVKNSRSCAKIYLKTSAVNPLEKFKKVQTMINYPPKDLTNEENPKRRTFAWPSEIIYSERYHHNEKTFCGFVMPLIDTDHYVFLQKVIKMARKEQRMDHIDMLSYAMNLSIAVQQIHENGHCIGDFKEENFFISIFEGDYTITFVDCDSFQISNPTTGTIHYCKALDTRNIYTAPELFKVEGRNYEELKKVNRHYTDLFILAIIIYNLIFLHHPFCCSGNLARKNNSVADKIEAGLFPYGKNIEEKGIIPPQYAKLKLTDYPNDTIKELFIRCFIDGHSNPKKRPEAYEWVQCFEEIGESISL